MNQFEMMSFAKFIMKAFAGNVSLSEAEFEAGTNALKSMADNAPNWNYQQKQTYKALVDIFKEYENGKNGNL